MSTKSILCVDDERSILVGLEHQIRQEFHDTFLLEFAESGAEALEVIDSFKDESIELTLLITDQMMPGMRGDELIKKVLSLSPQTKCILLSGYTDHETMNDLRQIPSIRVVYKPWEKTEIISLVKELCLNQ
jgi:YesN/AraC family two-component response regulator